MNRRSFFAASAAGIAAGVLPGVEAARDQPIEPSPENVAKLREGISQMMWWGHAVIDMGAGPIRLTRPSEFSSLTQIAAPV